MPLLELPEIVRESHKGKDAWGEVLSKPRSLEGRHNGSFEWKEVSAIDEAIRSTTKRLMEQRERLQDMKFRHEKNLTRRDVARNTHASATRGEHGGGS